jgi:hypothetical protein
MRGNYSRAYGVLPAQAAHGPPRRNCERGTTIPAFPAPDFWPEVPAKPLSRGVNTPLKSR